MAEINAKLANVDAYSLKQQATHFVDDPASGFSRLYVTTGTSPHGGLYLETDAGAIIGPFITGTASPVYTFVFGFHVSGALSTGTVNVRMLSPYTGAIDNVSASINTPPTGTSVILDINKGGTTIFTNQANRPTILAGTNDDTSSVPDVKSVTQNDVFTLDIDQIGSTISGSDLNVQIRGTKA